MASAIKSKPAPKKGGGLGVWAGRKTAGLPNAAWVGVIGVGAAGIWYLRKRQQDKAAAQSGQSADYVIGGQTPSTSGTGAGGGTLPGSDALQPILDAIGNLSTAIGNLPGELAPIPGGGGTSGGATGGGGGSGRPGKPGRGGNGGGLRLGDIVRRTTAPARGAGSTGGRADIATGGNQAAARGSGNFASIVTGNASATGPGARANSGGNVAIGNASRNATFTNWPAPARPARPGGGAKGGAGKFPF